jgi:hypothetical protein
VGAWLGGWVAMLGLQSFVSGSHITGARLQCSDTAACLLSG